MYQNFSQVQVWLEKLFGDKPVPAYELNEYTVGVLHNLMKRNEHKEADTQLLIDDLRQKADEYNAEGMFITDYTVNRFYSTTKSVMSAI